MLRSLFIINTLYTLATILTENYKKILAALAVILLLSVGFASRIGFVYDFESFFPIGDPDLEYYMEYKKIFEPDDLQYFIALHDSTGALTPEILDRVDTLTKQLELLPHITDVSSITNLYYPLKTPFGFTTIPAVHLGEPKKLEKDLKKITQDPLAVERVVSANGKTLLVTLKYVPGLTQMESAALNDTIQNTVNELGMEAHYAARINIQTEFIKTQIWEVMAYTIVSGLIVLLALWWMFRKAWTVVLSLATVLLAFVFFLGLLGALGVKLDVLSALFPILLLIVGLSDVIHMMSGYSDETTAGRSKEQAIQNMFRSIGMAVLLTSITTAIGFLSLYTSRIMPVRQFGITAAGGVMMAFAVAVVALPVLLMVFKKDQVLPKQHVGVWLDKLLAKVYLMTKSGSKTILIVSAIVAIASAYGISQLGISARIQNDLPKGEKVTSDFYFFENNMGGFRPFEMALIPGKGRSITDPEVIRTIDSLENYLASSNRFSAINSPVDVYQAGNRAFHANKLDHHELPDNDKMFGKIWSLVSERRGVDNPLVSTTHNLGRLFAYMKDVGSDTAQVIFSDIYTWTANNIDPDVMTIRITGTGLLFDNNNKYLIESLLYGMLIAFGMIGLIMTLLFRDLKMVIISLIPNILPLMTTAAMLTALGIDLDAPTSIIFTIAFGIAVDDTIHMLSRFRLELQKGHSTEVAIENTFKIAGKAIAITTLVLLAGFLVLTTSQLLLTTKVGLLVSLTLITALLGDLFLLPVLLRITFNKK